MLENPRAPRIRNVRKLSQRNERRDTGRFLLEGPQAVREALTYRPDLVEELFVTPTGMERHPGIRTLIDDAQVHNPDLGWEYATEEVLASMADTVTPQGFVAVARQNPTAVKDIFPSDGDQPRLIVICEEVRDPGNLGTILRAADAAGADAVILTGRTVDPFNPKVVRSTTGSLFHLPFAVDGDLADVVARSRGAGLQVLAADVKGDDLLGARASDALAKPTAWVFGNEARGLTDDALGLCDGALKLPIYGKAESLNLATAASVCLYESAFAQRTA
ncbi:TrmH family RNA methyltransferase [Microbacterium amylolyticum]|uniref:TrmH family RNA methyltransferase n=1 Tax=Microbacterium amylolyticum TaxID=936337 RepID=A0ABS4ZFQ7_9MICO|nr:RNA methyltransferase [Microbacterium amylolyticum]MBP2436123.1 TrmH family RNA methyltransferase [Microbacterium amylolyticum]